MNPAVRIFLVEDNPDHVFIALTVVRQVLGDDIELVHAAECRRGAADDRSVHRAGSPDLFLVDLRLPDNGGFSVLQAGAGERGADHGADVRRSQVRSTTATLLRAISSALRPFCASRCRAQSCVTSWYASARCRCRSGRTTRHIATRQDQSHTGWGRAVSCNDSSPFFFAGLTLAPANRILADGLLASRRDRIWRKSSLRSCRETLHI